MLGNHAVFVPPYNTFKCFCCFAVKLPEILGKMHMPERNLRALVKHLELFLRYSLTHSQSKGLKGAF